MRVIVVLEPRTSGCQGKGCGRCAECCDLQSYLDEIRICGRLLKRKVVLLAILVSSSTGLDLMVPDFLRSCRGIAKLATPLLSEVA